MGWDLPLDVGNLLLRVRSVRSREAVPALNSHWRGSCIGWRVRFKMCSSVSRLGEDPFHRGDGLSGLVNVFLSVLFRLSGLWVNRVVEMSQTRYNLQIVWIQFESFEITCCSLL